jgi:site-specific DNA-methyltransferase (adenine-specific)
VTIPVNQIICGDNVETLRTLPDACVDSCVTDPPYGLEFMGKEWDRGVPGVELWREVLRVLKPGGHLLAFAGTRTQHRMATAIEDAGFEIRDMIAWVYGSGFPKSLDVSKAIDKAAGAERKVVGSKLGQAGYSLADNGRTNAVYGDLHDPAAECAVTAPATEAAQQWAGWGTALKPSLEPITVARKPLCGTVAENVLQHGTGGLNVDGCRVGTDSCGWGGGGSTMYEGGLSRDGGEARPVSGRWPANLIHDGSDEVVGLFPETETHTIGKALSAGRVEKTQPQGNAYGAYQASIYRSDYADAGSAARFFYCAKADASERRNSKHPTIKPVALMRYLVRLVTPPGGLVLDPFGGSGTTAEAARLEHCRYLLMELNPEYCADAAERLRQKLLF